MFAKIIKLQSPVWWLGFCLLTLSFGLYLLLVAFNTQGSQDYFIINYCLTVVYALALFFGRKTIHPVNKQAHRILLYALLLVSAWGLNRTMTVFDISVLWMSVTQVLVICVLILLCFYRFLPPMVNYISVAILGVGSLLFLYMSLYLFPLYIFGLIFSPALGLSLHCFAPLLITITTIVLVAKMYRHRRSYLYSFLSGLFTALSITVFFCVQWSMAVNEINKAYNNSLINDKPDVPAWMQLSQQLKQTNTIEKILKIGIVYTQPDGNMNDLGWSFPERRNFHEAKKHDPLIALASVFAKPRIGAEDRIRILESTYNNRYATEERLWSGNNLVTENIITTVKIWPQWQLAYTEKTISVQNKLSPRFRGQEEGVYLFTLPEGSVVSSLSLWINGIEEKGVLTTKQKATTAYKTIVGVESRDPSVVHWQEGNQVSVRVFPVMPGDNRVFKIGVTSPLQKQQDELVYENIFFQGPSTANVTETIRLKMDESANLLSKPGFLKWTDKNQYEFDGDYKPDWRMRFKAAALSTQPFVYKGKAYSINRYEKQFLPHNIQQVYVDINGQWNKQELNEILLAYKENDILVHNKGWQKITPQNADKVFDELHKQSFSLFPLYDIKNINTALLITKGNKATPNLSDLSNTPFKDKMKIFLQSGEKLKVIDIGTNISPYLKTLIEYRALQYEKCNMEQLKNMAAKSVYPVNQETDNRLVLADAEIIIKREDSLAAAAAPDHVYRLFAYNNIMRQMGKEPADAVSDQSALIAEAEQAYIVSPVSSLIVLETQKDYERFDIKSSKDNLQNASHNNSGAVPEPHEWALIITGLIALWYLHKTKRLKRLA